MRTGGSASSKMTRSSGAGESPVERDGDCADLAGREEKLDHLWRATVDVRDARSPRTPAASSACASRFDRSSSSP